MGMKGFDTVAVYACSACHDVIDGRTAGDIYWQDMPSAIVETHEALIEAGILTVYNAKLLILLGLVALFFLTRRSSIFL